ncbi:hypothetical protein NZK27_01580 [Synechococcus sp. FGCU-3]|nr:hypothetical protein [Synechococcus sp. FGCU3]
MALLLAQLVRDQAWAAFTAIVTTAISAMAFSLRCSSFFSFGEAFG